MIDKKIEMYKKMIFLALLGLSLKGFSQGAAIYNNNPWIVGFGLSAIDDSGSKLGDFFKFNKSYHFSLPFKASVEKRFKDDFGWQANLSTNIFKEGKIYNEGVLEEDISFFAIDIMAKYYATNLFMNKYRAFFEGYGTVGIGRSFYDWKGGNTINIGGGLNFYIINNVRFFAQALAKISTTNSNLATNYFQYDFGFIYRLN